MDDSIRNYMKRNGVAGGKARAKSLSARRRKQIARKAAKARWSKR